MENPLRSCRHNQSTSLHLFYLFMNDGEMLNQKVEKGKT
jgi:hypothetical protein